MTGLTDTQVLVLRKLFGSAPDAAVRNLERALSEEAMGVGPMAAVYGLIAKEAHERRAKQLVFEPLLSLCGTGKFPSNTLRMLWAALRQACGPDSDTAVSYASRKKMSDEHLTIAAEIYDRLCLAAAAGLREPSPAFAAAVEWLNAQQPDGALTFAKYLDLTPLARSALARLPDWVGRMTGERAAAVRVAYNDACNLADDAGPRFVEMLVANLPEPWLVMRILAAAMDHPNEAYVSVSELAPFAERVLDDIDDKLSAFRALDLDGGRPAGLAAGEAIRIAAVEIAEFEGAVELSRESAWGKRIDQQRHALAQLAESRLVQIDKALDAALPVQMTKFGKNLRGMPKLDGEPDPASRRRAEALMAFFDCSRHFASQSGYGSARAKAAERIEARLDHYVEDLMEMVRTEQVSQLALARSHMNVSAAMMTAARGEKAGQLVRRRAASI